MADSAFLLVPRTEPEPSARAGQDRGSGCSFLGDTPAKTRDSPVGPMETVVGGGTVSSIFFSP